MIAAELVPFFSAVNRSTETPTTILNQMTKFQILCAQRQGSFGVLAMNELVETELMKIFSHIRPGEQYAGLRILITRNDHSIGLYNGDMGVLLKEDGRLRAFFPNMETSFAVADGLGKATAMTHKSQLNSLTHDGPANQIVGTIPESSSTQGPPEPANHCESSHPRSRTQEPNQ